MRTFELAHRPQNAIDPFKVHFVIFGRRILKYERSFVSERADVESANLGFEEEKPHCN